MVATIYGAEKDVYLVGTQQLEALGQKLETPDGSIFRYTEMAGTVGVANKLYQSSVAIANWTNQDATATLGDTSITFVDGGTAFVADEAAGGTLHAEEAGDLGATYRVKSNGVTAANNTIMQLENGVSVLATITANAITFIKNPWKDVIIHPSPATALVIGVQRNIIAANGFGWTQSRGVATCLANGIQLVGDELIPSNAIDGALGVKHVSGTGTVSNAATTAVITHNAGSTPTVEDVHYAFAEAPTNATTVDWLGTFTATQFTLTVNDPGASALDFGWSITFLAAPVAICLEVPATAEFGPVFLTIE